MKRIISTILTLLLCFLTLTFVACSSESQLHNQIAPAELSDVQLDNLDFVVSGRVGVFDFQVDDTFDTLTVYIDTFRNGELIQTAMEMELPFPQPRLSTPGRMAIIIPNDPHTLEFVVQQGTATWRHYFHSDTEPNGYGMRAYSSIIDPVDIALDADIVLLARTFGSGTMLNPNDLQTILTDSDTIARFPLVYVIRVRFS